MATRPMTAPVAAPTAEGRPEKSTSPPKIISITPHCIMAMAVASCVFEKTRADTFVLAPMAEPALKLEAEKGPRHEERGHSQ